MIWIALLLLLGLILSAFFSGSETGFYRVGRLRLALDARQGDPVAKAQLWLTNNPSLFVATTLVGNNLANYITSLGIVLATHRLVGDGNFAAELLAPVAATPFIFVYGELLPKSMFYSAPNRLLRLTGLPFLVFAVLFAPIAILLGVLGWMLQLVFGESHVRIRQSLARNELQRILREGHDAGLLGSSQSQLAQSIFNASSDRVLRILMPTSRYISVTDAYSRQDVINAGRRFRVAELLVRNQFSKNVVGYVRVADVLRSQQDWRDVTRSLMALRFDEKNLSAMVQMRSRGEALAEVVDAQGRTLGILQMERLLDSFLAKQ